MACETPIRTILHNAGYEPAGMIEEILQSDELIGFDVESEQYGNMLEMGIIDPTQVVIEAVKNAAHIASIMLTTEAIVVDSEAQPESFLKLKRNVPLTDDIQ